jgi:hypothetical protein
MPSNWLSYSGAVQVSFYTTKQKIAAIRLPTNQKPVADGIIVPDSFILPKQEGEFRRRFRSKCGFRFQSTFDSTKNTRENKQMGPFRPEE